MLAVEILRGCPKFCGVPNTRNSIVKVEDNQSNLVNDDTAQGEIHVKNECKNTTKGINFKKRIDK